VRQRFLLELHIGVEVDLGCFSRFMAQPKSHDTEIHATVKHRHGGAVTQRVRRDLLGSERWADFSGGRDMLCNQPLQGIGAQPSSVRTWEDRIICLGFLPGEPFLEYSGDIRVQRRASHLSALSEAANMGAHAELYILAPER